MINSVYNAANAFVTIFFNLPLAVFNWISLLFAVWLIIGILKLLWGAK